MNILISPTFLTTTKGSTISYIKGEKAEKMISSRSIMVTVS